MSSRIISIITITHIFIHKMNFLLWLFVFVWLWLRYPPKSRPMHRVNWGHCSLLSLFFVSFSQDFSLILFTSAYNRRSITHNSPLQTISPLTKMKISTDFLRNILFFSFFFFFDFPILRNSRMNETNVRTLRRKSFFSFFVSSIVDDLIFSVDSYTLVLSEISMKTFRILKQWSWLFCHSSISLKLLKFVSADFVL